MSPSATEAVRSRGECARSFSDDGRCCSCCCRGPSGSGRRRRPSSKERSKSSADARPDSAAASARAAAPSEATAPRRRGPPAAGRAQRPEPRGPDEGVRGGARPSEGKAGGPEQAAEAGAARCGWFSKSRQRRYPILERRGARDLAVSPSPSNAWALAKRMIASVASRGRARQCRPRLRGSGRRGRHPRRSGRRAARIVLTGLACLARLQSSRLSKKSPDDRPVSAAPALAG
jgi:hypothetical protein